MNRCHHRLRVAGFTFVEVLAALLFLAVVIPAVVTALTVSNRASEVADRGNLAGELAENKLGELLIDNAWQTAPANGGTLGEDLPGYRWEMSVQNWTTDTAHAVNELRVEVFYPVQGKERSVRLTTLVNPTGSTAGNNGDSAAGLTNP